MREIYISDEVMASYDINEIMSSISEVAKSMPESINDYVLVDEIKIGEANIKFFKGDETDQFCKKYNLTIKEYLMCEMRKQNGVKI